MPMYNLLCPNCRLDREEFVSYQTYCEHNSEETGIECPICKELKAFYSLSRLPENLKPKFVDVLNFYETCTTEKWYRGFNDLGRR